MRRNATSFNGAFPELDLVCTGEPNLRELHPDGGVATESCRGSLELLLSPWITSKTKVLENGYMLVRWNLNETCMNGCEESFNVRIEMLDRM